MTCRLLGLLGLFLICSTGTWGCGDDTKPPPPTTPDTSGRDGGLDGISLDVPPRRDTTPADGGTAGSCEGAGQFELAVDAERLRVGIGASRDTLAVVWSAMEPTGQNVMLSLVGETGDPGAAIPVTVGNARSQDPVITATETGWVVAYSSNVEDNFEIYTRVLDSAGAAMPDTDPTRITTNGLLDDRLNIGTSRGGVFLSWNQQDVRAGAVPVLVQTGLDANGAASGAEVSYGVDEGAYGRFAAGPFAAGWAAVWPSNEAGAAVQRFMSTSELRGTPIQVAEGQVLAVAYAPLETPISIGGVALVESLVGRVRNEVRWRSLLEDGTPSPSERPLINDAPTRAPSIAAIGEGHVAAVIANREDGAMLELLTLSGVGVVLAQGAVEPVAAFNATTTWIAATENGTVLVLVAERGEGDISSLRALRFECTLPAEGM